MHIVLRASKTNQRFDISIRPLHVVSCMLVKSIVLHLQANQKFSKSVLLKDLYLEIERMKQGLPMPFCSIHIFLS